MMVDDDSVTVQLRSSVLQAGGFQVRIASDAMQSVMMSVHYPPDAVRLDVGTPRGRGLQVAACLKASSKTSARPAIVLPALTDPEVPSRVQALGADESRHEQIRLACLPKALDRLLGGPAPVGGKS